jgi:hypothetical protein
VFGNGHKGFPQGFAGFGKSFLAMGENKAVPQHFVVMVPSD